MIRLRMLAFAAAALLLAPVGAWADAGPAADPPAAGPAHAPVPPQGERLAEGRAAFATLDLAPRA